MKILKLRKEKNNQYLIDLDNNTKIQLHEDLILKYELLIKHEIFDNEIDKLIKENNQYIFFDSAIKFLSKKMRCKFEVEQFLLKQGAQENEADIIIDMLLKRGYLNDSAYVTAYINDKINLSNDGPYKIIDNLKKYKIDEDIIKDAIEVYTEDIQRKKIIKQADKLIKSNNNKSGIVLKNKIYMYLCSLGYDKTIISDILSNISINDQNVYEKEYKKILDKLSKKYSGKELEYKIKEKLYQKGFTK